MEEWTANGGRRRTILRHRKWRSGTRHFADARARLPAAALVPVAAASSEQLMMKSISDASQFAKSTDSGAS